MRQLLGMILAMVAAILWQPATAAAQLTDASRATIDRLLNDLWSGGVETQRAARGEFRAQQSSGAAADPLVQWAYVLNRIEFDRYREAAEVVERLPESMPGNLDVKYAQIWLHLMTDQFNRALLEMQELKTMLLAASPNEATRFKFYSRLGRLYAFAEGPGQSQVRDTTLQDTLAVITDGLDDVDFGQFQNQRQQVSQLYTDLLNEKSSNVANLEQQQKSETEARRQQIAMDNQEMTARQAELAAEVNAIRDQANSDISKLRQAAAPFESELARLDVQIASVQSTIVRIANDIAILQNDAFYEEDPYWRARLLSRAAVARRELIRYEGDLAILQAQYNSVVAELDALSAQMASVQAAVNDQVVLRESEANEMRRQFRRNERDLQRMDRPRARTGYERNMDSRTNHLPTYDPFPTDELRQQVLNGLP